MSKTILIFSGGLDSTTLLYHLLNNGHEVKCLSINYGQRHSRELTCAQIITAGLDIEHRVLDLSSLKSFLGGSSQTSQHVPVPHGHYAAETMKVTVVPNRNMIMLAIAGGWAVAEKFDRIAIAAHAGDHAIYPDCRDEFFAPLGLALRTGNYHQVAIYRPYLTWTKAHIVATGDTYNVPYEKTYSCYEGRPLHCGECGTCVERREAFALAGVSDPTEYEVQEFA